MAKREEVKKKTSIGGQALIEGIMMRGPEKTAMSVRHTSGEIVTEEWPTSGSKRAKIWKLPLIRGVYNFVDSMYFGYKCLMRSAELSGIEDEEETAKPVTAASSISEETEEKTGIPAVSASADAATEEVCPAESAVAVAAEGNDQRACRTNIAAKTTALETSAATKKLSCTPAFASIDPNGISP